MAQPGSDRDRRPLVERVRAGGDFATRETTKPGAHIARPAELDDTHDEGDVTPVQGVAIRLADRVRQALEAEGYPFSARDQALLDALALESSHRLAELHAQMHAAGAGMPPRVRQLEAEVSALRDWRGKLTGVNDGNGRFGELKREVADLREDVGPSDTARADRAALATQRRWTRAAIAALGAAILAIGGSARVWLTSRDDTTRHSATTEHRIQRCEDALHLPPLRDP